jgi:hypothetical protein
MDQYILDRNGFEIIPNRGLGAPLAFDENLR